MLRGFSNVQDHEAFSEICQTILLQLYRMFPHINSGEYY